MLNDKWWNKIWDKDDASRIIPILKLIPWWSPFQLEKSGVGQFDLMMKPIFHPNQTTISLFRFPWSKRDYMMMPAYSRCSTFVIVYTSDAI